MCLIPNGFPFWYDYCLRTLVSLTVEGTLMKTIFTVAAVAFGTLMVCAPALAGTDSFSVPEPMSIALLTGGIAAIAAVKSMRRK